MDHISLESPDAAAAAADMAARITLNSVFGTDLATRVSSIKLADTSEWINTPIKQHISHPTPTHIHSPSLQNMARIQFTTSEAFWGHIDAVTNSNTHHVDVLTFQGMCQPPFLLFYLAWPAHFVQVSTPKTQSGLAKSEEPADGAFGFGGILQRSGSSLWCCLESLTNDFI